MIAPSIYVLLASAAGLALVHTLIGVDHVVPFVAMSRAQGWSLRRTVAVTAACGLGHVLSSVLLGGVGMGLGIAAERLLGWESRRGGMAAWLLIGFGLAYAAWAVWRNLRARRHEHPHAHADGTIHVHHHDHRGEHLHPHGARILGPWTLFVIFAFGPCEALIPLMMAPAAAGRLGLTAGIVVLFGAVTIATMVTLVTAATLGLRWRALPSLERHVHLIAGLTIALSGAAVRWLGI